MKFPDQLVEGYQSFRDMRLPTEQRRYGELAESGQRPEIMVIGCCDSRVSPEVIFDARPGELFVLRNVANLVPPYSPSGMLHGVSAALEFAVQVLEVKDIVVLGHGQCGGIRAFAAQGAARTEGDFIGKWISLIKPAADALGAPSTTDDADYLTRLEQASILYTIGNLMTFPWIRSRVQDKKLALHGAFFAVATGMLSVHDPQSGAFVAIAGDTHIREDLTA